MRTSTLKADGLLLFTAAIWGLAFVAQRLGLEHLGPYSFNFARFLLGALSLVPVLWLFGKRMEPRISTERPLAYLYGGGLAAGLLLFIGSSFQQVGLLYTTAGKAGFITGLYLIFVPILGLLWKMKTHGNTWLGALLAVGGLYLLSVTEEFTIMYGDLLELIGAVFWAGHVLLIGWLSPKVNVLKLSLVQIVICMLLSLAVALLREDLNLAGIQAAWQPIAYAGILSVGVAYTLQIIGQREAPASHAAIILSLEAVFAVLGGWLLLSEELGLRGTLGCSLMLAGMLLSQFSLPLLFKRKKSAEPATT